VAGRPLREAGRAAAEFDAIHSVVRAVEVGSVDRIVSAAELRPHLIETVERGIGRGRHGSPRGSRLTLLQVARRRVPRRCTMNRAAPRPISVMPSRLPAPSPASAQSMPPAETGALSGVGTSTTTTSGEL
jgi:hypothetical protein